MNDGTLRRPKLELIILDCPDALVLARFYSAVLGWELDEGASPIWAKLVPPKSITSGNNTDARPTLAFHAITDWVEPTWPGGEHPQQFTLICPSMTSAPLSPRC